jgi:chromosomal replication initiation ATPase DnaA
MKVTTFEKLIRKVIREEVNRAIKREFSVLKEELTSNPSTQKPLIESDNDDLTKFRNELKSKMPIPNFPTGDNTLNSLLAETAMAPTPEEIFNANDPVNQFINKDYSQIMGAIDGKKNYRP